MPWNAIPIHIIDFEGTRTSGILEFGIVTLYHGKIQETHTALCQAQGTITFKETRQHGISQVDTQGMPPFSAHWDRFASLRKSGALGAHYASVENRLLKHTWPYPSKSPDFLNPGNTVPTWSPWIDTYALYCAIYPQCDSHKLIDLVRYFQLEEDLNALALAHCPPNRQKHHAALYDALASALLLMHLAALPSFKNLTLEWLLINSAASNETRGALEQRLL